jgi:hypothetical protein
MTVFPSKLIIAHASSIFFLTVSMPIAYYFSPHLFVTMMRNVHLGRPGPRNALQ